MIGRHVLARLRVSDPARTFVVLSRKPSGDADGRVIPIAGDLRLPRLGLAPNVWTALQRSISGIIHSAAEIRFDLPLDAARAVNVGGTRTLLDLARSAPLLRRMAHISTTYVTGRSAEHLPESRFENKHGFFSSYQESKYEAEQLVMEAAGDVPVSIYRLSTVIGDSRTGAVEQYN